MKTALQRIKEYIDFKGLPVSVFEKSVGMSNGSFASQLKHDKTIGVDKLEKILSKYPDLSSKWVLNGAGPMILDETDHLTVNEGKAHYGQAKKIPLLPASAIAGKGTGTFGDLAVDQYYEVPDFNDADFIIRVKGDSMVPKYASGDLLACKHIKKTLFFQWNRPYVIYTSSQGLIIKRVKKSSKEGFIACIQDNNEYEMFEIPIADIVSLALIIGLIRTE